MADVLLAELAARAALRPARPAPAGFSVPGAWRGPGGEVSPYLLSAAINSAAVPRAAQDEMAGAIRSRLEGGPDLVVEAPTGTGKSLAALAAALDWLAGSPGRQVVVATHTKDLQSQLAKDVEGLARAEPGFDPGAGIVKGAANRLSLRALVNACADLASPPPGPTGGARADARFAELVVYLLLRFLAPAQGVVAEAEARSVDTADVPLFFSGYTGGRWSWYLAELSQAAAGDYEGPRGLGAHTLSVAEQLAGLRLVIANHALVFAHLEDLARRGDATLLVVDEAHALEASATEAMSARLGYQQVEEASRALSRWARRPDATSALRNMAAKLAGLLSQETMPAAAMVTMDRIAGPATDKAQARAATLASPFSGDAHAAATRMLLSELGRTARLARGAHRALFTWYQQAGRHLSRSERERYSELEARLDEVSKAAAKVAADVDTVLGTGYLAPSRTPGRASAQPSRPDDELDSDHGDEDEADEEQAGAEGTGAEGTGVEGAGGPGLDQGAAENGGAEEEAGVGEDGQVGTGSLPRVLPAGNAVVWLAEQPGSDLARGRRGYRFELASRPIRLTAEPTWARFRSSFARTVLTSATLTTSGNFAYLDDRLGTDDCDKVVLEGPYDYRRQARLVCFSDFPSWSEHTEAAMRSVAHQLAGYGREALATGQAPGAVVLTTATATAAGIARHLAAYSAAQGLDLPLAAAPLLGNHHAVRSFRERGGWLVGTKGLWAGVDIPEAERTRVVWVNKLPFAPFAEPLVAARRAEVAARAEAKGHPDPEAAVTERYYLPLASVELRQAAGRLVRSGHHRGVIVVSDRKLAGRTSLRRLYRRVLLESLDPGLHVPDPETGEATGGNVVTMAEGWARIWEFLAEGGDISPSRLPELTTPEALEAQTLLAETREVRRLELSAEEVGAARAAGRLEELVVERAAQVGGLLRFEAGPIELKAEQRAAIAAAARGDDLLALLPTGFGKSYCFQLPALVLPGTTIVVSPLVALMADQALELNRAIGGAVRALVSPMRESSSRAGRQEVAEQLTGAAEHHIKLVYASPERFAHRQFREWVRAGIAGGRVNRVVFDEAHTLVTWGDDFRPSYRRLAVALADLRAAGGGRLPVSALTATANKAVRSGLRTGLFGLPEAPGADPAGFTTVSADPVRPELAIYKFWLRRAGPVALSRHVEAVFDAASSLPGHSIFYCLTVREVDALYAHLRDYAGPAETSRVRRFHGRMPEAEKAAVLADFRDAPHAGEEGFVPMVVVATSAFGLGIDRGDVRCVFVASPPTDLAALYQQMGRAGRDAAGRAPAPDTREGFNAGVALGSARGFRTAEFITGDLPTAVLERAGRLVLGTRRALDARRAAEAMVEADLEAGRLAPEVAAKEVTRERYRTAVMRAVAVLADCGAVEDLGDFPQTVCLRPGEAPAPEGDGEADRFGAAARAWVEADPARARRASVLEVHEHLAGLGLVERADPAATWAGLVECHHAGVLDTSAAPNRAWLTALAVRSGAGSASRRSCGQPSAASTTPPARGRCT